MYYFPPPSFTDFGCFCNVDQVLNKRCMLFPNFQVKNFPCINNVRREIRGEGVCFTSFELGKDFSQRHIR